MTQNEFFEARRKMSRLLASEEIGKRIALLPVRRNEFTKDILSGIASSTANAFLNESEVFALYELSAKMGLRLNEEKCGAFLTCMNGHPAVTMDFANLMNLSRRLKGGGETA
ncbi:MAG: hypothetical protein IIW08_05080 [Clostridia bacterium]|nr:hypothetical protein [Clostridia bacterium]MBQ2434490.1 hypothetical protein [Clostridia bacterium]MBQ5770531.1 hypothetical protein [Clostridia bacterium]